MLLALTLAACSYSVDFVVVNASERPIEIAYKIRGTGVDPFAETSPPATLAASQLSSREWRELSPAQYALNREERAVTVSLGPGLALRVHEDERGGRIPEAGFIIQELDIRGARGEIGLEGEQVLESFVAVPKPFLDFGPQTLFALTYR